ncbi:MAG: hypothetical protein ACKVRN_06245 [Pyrinomonadaceae bacterium]
MKDDRNIFAVILSAFLITLVFIGFSAVLALAQTQESNAALQRGYRTGYSDGFMSGYKDAIDSQAKDHSRHADYTRADRAYSKDYGSIDDYRDGYQQGFESGYDTGFEKRSFDANLPADLNRRSVPNNQTQTAITGTTQTETSSVPDSSTSGNAIIIIPRDTELILELQDDLSTQQSREGTKFTARVAAPSEIAGAVIEGRVSKIRQPGRLKQRSEMSLSFDRIILSDSRWSNFSAVMTEVLAVKGDNVKRVDEEGTAIGQNSYKQDAIKIGAPTGAGLIIGGIAGGPVGAAVGAGVGAAFGVGAVVVQRGKHIRLNRNQQLRVKTAYETQIR